ncbi:hypothetical protein KUTeg_018798 [Tegillarca granosa]|uniref:Uncharacterized protein n=1 Tax=Tegillarca granosa TaxID=220873 RepID=A0ABQ9EKB5_TEGGR|nr:hypothetical protein KUTeg_018798 [Tegillarca granosa]
MTSTSKKIKVDAFPPSKPVDKKANYLTLSSRPKIAFMMSVHSTHKCTNKCWNWKRTKTLKLILYMLNKPSAVLKMLQKFQVDVMLDRGSYREDSQKWELLGIKSSDGCRCKFFNRLMFLGTEIEYIKIGECYEFCKVSVRTFNNKKSVTTSPTSTFDNITDIRPVTECDNIIVKPELLNINSVKCVTFSSCISCSKDVGEFNLQK